MITSPGYNYKIKMNEPYTVIFDLETQSKISDSFGSSDAERIRNLEVSVMCALAVPSAAFEDENVEEWMHNASMHTYWRDDETDPRGPFESFLELCDGADLIVSYNGLHFDHNVLRRHYRSKTRFENHLSKAHDAFARIRDVSGVWLKLDALLKANRLETKTANGLEAIAFWNEGKRDLLAEYCAGDVRQCAKLLAKDELALPNTTSTLPNYVFGVLSALAARRASEALRNKKRAREAREDGV